MAKKKENGFTKRFMDVYEGAEEILVSSCDHCITAARISDCDRWWVIYCPVYLHFILEKHAPKARS